MDLALNNLRRLICHNIQPTKSTLESFISVLHQLKLLGFHWSLSGSKSLWTFPNSMITITITVMLMFYKLKVLVNLFIFFYFQSVVRWNNKIHLMAVFVSASHQTGVNTGSMIQRSIIVGIRGGNVEHEAESRAVLVYPGHQLT